MSWTVLFYGVMAAFLLYMYWTAEKRTTEQMVRSIYCGLTMGLFGYMAQQAYAAWGI